MKQFLEQEAVLESNGAEGGSIDPEELQVSARILLTHLCATLSQNSQWDFTRRMARERNLGLRTGGVRGAVQFRQRVQAMRDAAEDQRGYERDRMEEVKADVFRRRAEARRARAEAAAAERASHREQEEEAEEARRQAEMEEAQRTFQMALSGKLDAKPKKVQKKQRTLSPHQPLGNFGPPSCAGCFQHCALKHR